MTENEAKNILEEVKILDDSMYQYNMNYLNALDIAIKSLEKIQQYRAIGTVEECREARERHRGKKVHSKDGKLNHCEADRALSCPVCNAQLNYCEYQNIPFCYNCGQKLDWSDTT